LDGNIREIVKILYDKEAADIVLLDVSEVSNLTSYFVIATANSDPHMEALRDGILDFLEKHNVLVIYYDKGKGYDWMVIDCGYFIVHIFSNRGREFYALEDLWLNAKRYDVEEIISL